MNALLQRLELSEVISAHFDIFGERLPLVPRDEAFTILTDEITRLGRHTRWQEWLSAERPDLIHFLEQMAERALCL